VLPNSGLTDEDVRTAPLAFIPVFMGTAEVRHWWALLVIADRTEYEQGIFDSLPGFDKKMFHNAKSLLELCDFSDCKWIRALMQKQGFETNDCGVWMCCVASIYTKSIFSRAVP
jgi:hypothetical protein